MQSRTRLIVTVLAAFSSSLSCVKTIATAEGASLTTTPSVPPKLVVFITIDQFRGDMIDRFRGDLRHGLARLSTGAWLVNAFHDHAITETAPGHATVLSGRFPRSTGITSNLTGGVIDRNYPLLTGLPNEIGASPERFHGTALFDWLHTKNNRARALSVSRKDRGAILPVGRAKQDVYWYAGDGSFTTSRYYRDSLPTWVKEFNAREIPQRYAGTAWTLSRDSATYSEPDSVPLENGGRDFVFPHRFPSDTLAAVNYLTATPSIDSITALFALEGLRRIGLGEGPQTDLLAVSFSATDYIGHAFGPDSREAHENVIRLDETLGWFLDSLYRLRDSSGVIIALTGDHGVQPIPELARARGEATGDQGLRVSLRAQVAEARAGLRAAGADTMAFFYDQEVVAIDRPALAKVRLNADSILDAFARGARQVRGVARVDRIRNVRRADFATDVIARRWAHQIPDESPIELVMTLTRYSTWNRLPATHGSPYDQDAFVPIIFYGPWVKPGRYANFARTVDIAPTIAAIVGVRPSEKLDGVVLVQVLK